MITHILQPWQDPATVGLIVLPVVPQPNEHEILHWKPGSPYALYQDRRHPNGCSGRVDCPLGAVGDRVMYSNNMEYVGGKHEITSVDCKLVRDIGLDECVAAGVGGLAGNGFYRGDDDSRGSEPDRLFFDQWQHDHPTHPWDSSWAWFVGVRRVG
jgi:hypothetical protein